MSNWKNKKKKKLASSLTLKKNISVIIDWVSDSCLMPIQQFVSYIIPEQVNFQWNDDEVRFVLYQH
jgi:hypothetical protein